MDTSDNEELLASADKREINNITALGCMIITATMLLFIIIGVMIGKPVTEGLVMAGSVIAFVEYIVFAAVVLSSKKCTNYGYAVIFTILSVLIFSVLTPVILVLTAKCEGMSCLGMGIISIGYMIAGGVAGGVTLIASVTAIKNRRMGLSSPLIKPETDNQEDESATETELEETISEEATQPVVNDNGISVLKRDDLKEGVSYSEISSIVGYSGVSVTTVILMILSTGLALATPLRSGIRLWSTTLTFICCIPVAVLFGILLLNICLAKTIQKRTNIAIILCSIPAFLSIIYNILDLDRVSPIGQIASFGYIFWGVPLLSIILALSILITYIATLGKTSKSRLPKKFSIAITIIAVVLYLVLAFLP